MENALSERPGPLWNFPTIDSEKCCDERIAVLGLGYVGLPLGLAFADHYARVVGYDCNEIRVNGLRRGTDHTNETDALRLRFSTMEFSGDESALDGATAFVVTVPTPVDSAHRPDLGPLLSACRTVGRYLQPGGVVIFQSTVYPGATEEVCLPELARFSGLTPLRDFTVAYSPERINPGDRERGLGGVVKVVAGQDEATLNRVAAIYEKVVDAGVHRAGSIRVAEAAKVFENTQRDVNIGLMNELALICERLNLPTRDVIEATGTKWNALPFRPGLVGGHCIGVDPYYLAHKAEECGITPQIMLASRRVNESIASLVAQKGIRHLARGSRPLNQARVGLLGLTFKEDVPDMRNSKVMDMITEFNAFGIRPLVHDPVMMAPNAPKIGVDLVGFDAFSNLDLVVLAVPHSAIVQRGTDAIAMTLRAGGLLIDVKSVLPRTKLTKDVNYWSL